LHARGDRKRRDHGPVRVTAAIVAVIGLGFLAGGVYRELRGSDPSSGGGVPVFGFDVESALLGRTMHELAAVPQKPRANGLVVLLRRRKATPALLEGLRDLGPRAPVVVLVGGAPAKAPKGRFDSYVLVEAIPDALKRFELANRVAVGGPGARALARLDPGRFCAARASAAIRPLALSLRGCD
jgi:hypothetical protein